MGWLPYAVMAAGYGINYLRQRSADKKAREAHQNDPRNQLRRALLDAMVKDYPALRNFGYEGAMRTPNFNSASIWDAISGAATQGAARFAQRRCPGGQHFDDYTGRCAPDDVGAPA